MKFSPQKFLSCLMLAVFLLSGCSKLETANQNGDSARTDDNRNGENSGAASVKDDVEELGKIIKLPFAPEEATWREETINPVNGKRLTAVIKFSPDDAVRFSAAADGKPQTLSDIDAETWFPAELVAQSQLSGDESLKGVSISADEFFQAPYTQGKITRVNATNYFVLELSGD